MSDIHVGDLVVNSDSSVIGEVLATSTIGDGLRRGDELDLWETGAALDTPTAASCRSAGTPTAALRVVGGTRVLNGCPRSR
jgi:hypothetical protein